MICISGASTRTYLNYNNYFITAFMLMVTRQRRLIILHHCNGYDKWGQW